MRTIIITTERNIISQPFKKLYFSKHFSYNGHAVYNVGLQIGHRDRVQYRIVLIVIANSPIAISLIVITTVGIIYRPHRRHHQGRLNNTIRSGSIHPIGSRIRRRKIKTEFQSFIFSVQIHTHAIFLEIRIDDNTFFIIIIGRNKITNGLSSAGDRNIMAGCSRTTENCILPVCVR